jgi:hypothetical protein
MLSRARGPRAVIFTRRTPLQLLLAQHGTLGQARFFLESRKQRIASYEDGHERFMAALTHATSGIPEDWRRAVLDRDAVDRFLFGPDDVILAVGQDGLVANVAKYLTGQPVVGVNADPTRFDGVLCRIHPSSAGAALRWAAHRDSPKFHLDARTLVDAMTDDGSRLRALNEIFVGHVSHQSARYTLTFDGRTENHSSSGIICATGTGATGWARSIRLQRSIKDAPPSPNDPSLEFFVREPFPSVSTATGLSYGRIREGSALRVVSQMGEGGVVFADGVEADRLPFSDGRSLTITLAPERLLLVTPPGPPSVPPSGRVEVPSQVPERRPKKRRPRETGTPSNR